MQNNLYLKIKSLVDRKYELKKLGGIIKFDKNKQELYQNYAAEYKQIEDTLDFITKNCHISPLMVADIISKKHGMTYVLKIFRETKVVDGRAIYTGNFIICYLNKQNKFFDYEQNGVSFSNRNGLKNETYINYELERKEFMQFLLSITSTNAMILATSAEQSFIPTLFPSSYLEGINFVKLFVYGYVDDFVCDKFQHEIKLYIKEYLEGIDADAFLSKKGGSQETIK